MNQVEDKRTNHVLHVVADAPSRRDLLGFETSINALLRIISSEKTITPFTIGILGDWGTGKSTLMLQLASKLNDLKFPVVIFNPWKYDGREEIIHALIQTVILSLNEIAPQKARVEVLKDISRGFSRVIASTAISTLTQGAVKLDELVEEYSKIKEANIQFVNQFESTFTGLVDEYVLDKKLVIFIDDLDRCIPENAIKVLEAIKLFLSVPKCVFVIGLESTVIQQGIRLRYGENLGFSGKDYLEKIIQLPFSVPTSSDANIRSFARVLSFPENLPESIVDVAVIGAESNPRRIKRFLNSYNLLKEILNLEFEKRERKNALRDDILAFILMLQIRFPDLYQYYFSNPKDCLQIFGLISEGKILEKEEVDRINAINPSYSLLLSNPVFSKFIKSISSRKSLQLTLGDEGLMEYFTITQAVSSVSATEQDYYLPESKKFSSFTNVGRNLYMVDSGAKKIDVIKVIRQLTALGLGEAKTLSETPGGLILENVPNGERDKIQKMFDEAGGKVEFR